MNSIILFLLTLVVGVLLYFKIRHQPALFRAEALQSALFTLGLLAVFLIVLVGFFMVTM